MSGRRGAALVRRMALGALGIVCVILAPWSIAVALGVRPIVLERPSRHLDAINWTV